MSWKLEYKFVTPSSSVKNQEETVFAQSGSSTFYNKLPESGSNTHNGYRRRGRSAGATYPDQARLSSVLLLFLSRAYATRTLYSQDKRLLRAILLIVVLLNAPVGQYILYPFMLFSTWIHELFHGLAAISVGGSITWYVIHCTSCAFCSNS